MTAYLSANGVRVVSLDLSIPYYGIPVADIALASGTSLKSPVTLTVGNMTLAMTVNALPSGALTTQTFAGVTTARLVGGAGGWNTVVSLSPYRAPPGSAGVLLSSVLSDLGRATGETIKYAADRVLGPFFVPEVNVVGSRILTMTAGALWWTDLAGVTQVASSRPVTTITSHANVENVDGGRGWATVSTEDPKSWQPGATYTSALATLTVAAVRIRSGADGVMRLEALLN